MSFETVAVLVALLLVMCGAVGALLGAILILKPSDEDKASEDTQESVIEGSD